MSAFLVQMLAVLRKELRQITRDRRMLPILVLAPMLQLVVFGFAANFEVDDLPLAVCDQDGTATSRALRQQLSADRTFRDVGPALDCTHPELDVRQGRARVVVTLPAGLARDLAADRTAHVQALIDGTNPTVGRYAQNAIVGWSWAASAPVVTERLQRVAGLTGAAMTTARLTAEPRLLYNPGMESSIFMVPGVAAMILLVITMIAASMGLAREREAGTLEQVIVTPIGVVALLLGKVLPFVLVGLFDVLLVLVVGNAVFDVPIRGSLALLLLGTLLYLMSTVGLGLFVSTVSRSQQQAFMIGFFVMMPAVLLSGVMTPISSMPEWLQPLTYVNPLRYYVEVLRGVLLKAAGLDDLVVPFSALLLFGVAILGAASLRFRKRLG